MRNSKGYLLPLLLLTVVTGSIVGSGCRKENGIDNNTVINTPYGVYFSDRLGALYGTNDGKAYKTIFPTDGYNARAIATSGPNILWIKNNLHVSADNGLNFNPARFNASTLVTPTSTAHWASMMLDVPSHNRIYVAATNSTNGIASSKDNGLTWENESLPATAPIQSFAQLKNGNVYAIDNTGSVILERLNNSSPWTPVTINTPLPAGSYHLGHFNNALVAADINGTNGIYFSNNLGVDWVPYAGIPTNQEIYSINAPFDQVLLAGCDSAGIYRLAGNTFVPSNNGLVPFTRVYGIVGKQDIYKNQDIIQYVYIATNKGIFRSVDLGQNWTLVRAGDFRAIY